MLLACTAASAETLLPANSSPSTSTRSSSRSTRPTRTGDTVGPPIDGGAAARGGFADADVQVFKPAPRKGNLVARLHGTGARKPILLLAHIDVVEASARTGLPIRSSSIEKDGYFYGRGSATTSTWRPLRRQLIRYKQEGYRPDRDIILALETDEEILDADGFGIQWLIKNHRDLIDADSPSTRAAASALKAATDPQQRPDQRESHRALTGSRSPTRRPFSVPRRTTRSIISPTGSPGSGTRLSARTRTRDPAVLRTHRELETPQVAADIPLAALRQPRSRRCARLSAQSRLQRATAHDLRRHPAGGRSRRQRVAADRARHGQLPGSCRARGRRYHRDSERVLADYQISSYGAVQLRCGSAPSAHRRSAVLPRSRRPRAEFWPGMPVVPVMGAGAPTGGSCATPGSDLRSLRARRPTLRRPRHGKDERV